MSMQPARQRHFTSRSFWTEFRSLPDEIKNLAFKNFELLKQDARHPSLQFKKVGELWSARVGKNHRALATETEDGFLWVWIGLHKEYERLIKQAQK
jgi:hypothetical protein